MARTDAQPGTTPRTEVAGSRAPLPRGPGYAVKRAVLGPALPTANLIHERLGKVTALAIFSSDALSSVAYATQEMLITLFAAGVIAAAAFHLIVPLSLVIVSVLAILMFSYRQTIKAYPSAGGAYIVTKDNFGLLPAQVAGVALLTDYVLTVAVSVSAGVAAVVAVFPELAFLRVEMAVLAIVILALGNLRGVKESGRIFAAPTYVFITMIFSLLVIGAIRWATGSLHVASTSATYATEWAAAFKANVGTLALVSAVPLGLAMHALASGSAAMTGVEAISNGVPAFKPPEWRNARTTLMVMGATLGTMFLGISILAQRVQAVPDPADKDTVLAEIGRAIYGTSGIGHLAFLILQGATMLILVLAANTAFADFPRLANFHADDAFLPRQFTTRGHRLVFSNGIIALAGAATLLVVAFGADVTHLIPFYAIGVFTSFTLSQAGMARRHLRLREPSWRLGLFVNGLGSLATGLLLLVIGVTKFTHGAWAVMVLVPVMVFLLVRMNHQYDREKVALERDLAAFGPPERLEHPVVVLLVDELDPRTVHALQYAKTLRTKEVIAVHLEEDPERTRRLQHAWRVAGLDAVPLRVVPGRGEDPARLCGFVGALSAPQDTVLVVVPVPHQRSRLERLSEARAGARLTRALLPYENVAVTLVRDHPEGVHPLQRDPQGRPIVHLSPRATHDVVILIDKLDRATLRAIRYAMTLGGTTVRALHAAADPDRAVRLGERWQELNAPVPLDIVECWDRDVSRTIERHIVSLSRGGSRGSEVTVVMPRRDFPKLHQRLLHDRTSRRIHRALGRYPHIDVADVPYFVHDGATVGAADLETASG
ncbi:MAG: APC family permease [Planctomycetaceae bacterium]